MENLREQILVRCVVHDDVHVGLVEVLRDTVEGDNARVSRCDLADMRARGSPHQ